MKSGIASKQLLVIFPLLLLAFAGNSAFGQNGKLSLQVSPSQAHVYVDGHPIGEASKRHMVKLSPGEHAIEIVNYGFVPTTEKVTITEGQTTALKVDLAPSGGPVSSPWGAMTIEGANHDAILLNGKTPAFLVGHGDEFNHEWSTKQELIVPPGTYLVTVLNREQEVWSGSVDVPANKRVVIDIPKGVRKTIDWPRGQKLAAQPRFKAGTASATVAVAKPTVTLSAAQTEINCGDPSQLKWSSTDAPQIEIRPVGTVEASGVREVRPLQTTTYQIAALGPGGTATSDATVNVNKEITADLQMSQGEVQYKRVGEKVDAGDASLQWKVSNANQVQIDQIGSVDANGKQVVTAKPRKNTPGPVDETVAYTLTATNPCGGQLTRTATLRIVGSIEEGQLAMRSIYFPTDTPMAHKQRNAVVPSEQEVLKSIADAFKQVLATSPDAHLVLSGYADERGPANYNLALSERRAAIAKAFLMEQGISADNLETHAYGEQHNLTAEEVKLSLQQHPTLSDSDRQKALAKLRTTVLAHNRRVDIRLSTTGQESARHYPFASGDYSTLIDRNKPQPKAMETATAD